MKSNSNSLTKILASSLLSSAIMTPLHANESSINPYVLSFKPPSTRIDGTSLNAAEEIDFYILYKNEDNNGWAFERAIQQEDNSVGDGTNFSFSVSRKSERSSAMFGIIAVDNNGMKSEMGYGAAANSDSSSGEDTQTSRPTLENHIFDLTKNPVSTYGNFEKQITPEGVEMDSYYTLGTMGCHYELPLEESLSLGDYSTLRYEVESKTQTGMVFSVLSGNFWYSKRVDIDQGNNEGMISLTSFSRSFIPEDTSVSSSIPIYSGEPVYLSDLSAPGIDLSISGASVSCASAQLTLKKLGVYK